MSLEMEDMPRKILTRKENLWRNERETKKESSRKDGGNRVTDKERERVSGEREGGRERHWDKIVH